MMRNTNNRDPQIALIVSSRLQQNTFTRTSHVRVGLELLIDFIVDKRSIRLIGSSVHIDGAHNNLRVHRCLVEMTKDIHVIHCMTLV